MFRVLLTDYAWPNLDIERSILQQADAELIVSQQTDAQTLAQLAADSDAIMTNWAKVPKEVIATARRCKIISRLGIGLDNIDVAAATQHGIVVTNVPDYCVVEVAEHALALLLSLSRKTAFYHYETKSGRYNLQDGPLLRRIEGQTLGIVGLGNIGHRLAEKAVGLKMHVLATRPHEEKSARLAAWRHLVRIRSVAPRQRLHQPACAFNSPNQAHDCRAAIGA